MELRLGQLIQSYSQDPAVMVALSESSGTGDYNKLV